MPRWFPDKVDLNCIGPWAACAAACGLCSDEFISTWAWPLDILLLLSSPSHFLRVRGVRGSVLGGFGGNKNQWKKKYKPDATKKFRKKKND